MFALEDFFNEITKGAKFSKQMKIPRKIIKNNEEYPYLNEIKYGGYGIIFFYSKYVIKVVSCIGYKNIKKYIMPEIEGVKLLEDNPYFITGVVLNKELKNEHMKTDIPGVFFYDGCYFTMILMKKYKGDIYKPIYKNIFHHEVKQKVLKFVLEAFISLLEVDKIYGDIKLEQILYKYKNGKLKLKIGDLGSITNLNFSYVGPTYCPVNYMRTFKMTTIQVLLFSLGNLWFDLYRNHYKLNKFHLCYKKIVYDDNFKYLLHKEFDNIYLHNDKFKNQKEIVLEWLSKDLKNCFVDIEQNKDDLEYELNRLLSEICHNNNTDNDEA